ncbi:hypothetical protein PNH38_08035 [Anoxybacillus rupiensis]|uniref:Uncharacterized protein n=1 Tax=Anoxybacteroides rupiense TaxID=311460 RepID=A0ABT5W6X1_9BACL|nr:hypothetical protein [Anoxybacillus rupiensis]
MERQADDEQTLSYCATCLVDERLDSIRIFAQPRFLSEKRQDS